MRPAFFIAVILVGLCSASPAIANGFSDWAAIVVAGDWHADSGAPSPVFDNARRDIAGELVGIGFNPQNILQFSVRPERDHAHAPRPSHAQLILSGLSGLAKRARAGCLAYFTSHGSEDGIAMGKGVLSPRGMARILDKSCGERPAVVIVSACFSGVFLPALARPNRMVLTAAAYDRPSFGCGEADKYTFFDTCAVQWLPKAGDFPRFAKDVIACIKAREKKENVDLPSNPQLYIDPHATGIFPRWK
jgi:hypothetical protein